MHVIFNMYSNGLTNCMIRYKLINNLLVVFFSWAHNIGHSVYIVGISVPCIRVSQITQALNITPGSTFY